VSTERSGAVTPGRRGGGRYLPAVLDAIVPGVGHLVAGRRGLAALFLAPIVALVLGGIVVLATTSLPRLAATLVDPDVLFTLLAIQVLLLVWRLVAVGSSLLDPRLPRPGVRDALPIAALLAVLVIAPQAYAGYATQVARETSDAIFASEPSPIAVVPSGPPEPDPSFLDTAPPSESLSPSPTPTPAVPRINALIIGVDAGVGRRTYLTDTMIVASLDPVANTVSMVSVPRDMVDVPLGDGRRFTAKINGLVAYARLHPRQFPGSDGTGFDVLENALGALLDLDIRYHAVVNLQGFVNVIDRLGSIDVSVQHSFCDPSYHEYGYPNGFSITKGRHRLDGQAALAYARVRKPAGESDFTRAARQQEVLSGIRDKLVSGGFVNDPIGLMRALSNTITTNVPRKMLPDLADAMSKIGRTRTYRAVITSPLVRPGFDQRGSIQKPDLAKIRALADSIFSPTGTPPPDRFLAPDRQPGAPTSSGVTGCRPAPTPRPTIRPTPKPTAKATAKPTATPVHTATATPVPPTPTPTPGPTPTPT